MGLDFSHGDAHWAYSGFHRFRVRIAACIGLDLTTMDGFGSRENDYRGLPWDTVNDPIKPLLDHSDCDGDLSPEECAQVAPRLRELILNWPEDDYDKRQAIQLADAMEYCAKRGERLEFC